MSPLFDLSGHRALITGSSQRIGFGLAKGLAQSGAEVVLNGRDVAKLSKASDELARRGAMVHQLAFDATDHAAVRAAVDGFEGGMG